MSVLGPTPHFWGSVATFVRKLLGPYVRIMDAKVVSVTGTPPNQKAVVARPDELAALASGEITEIARPAYPVYGSVAVDQQVWCIAWGAGLRIMGVPTGSGSGGVTSHAALTGLTSDDHPQYHTDARGDARYQRLQDERIAERPASDAASTYPLGVSIMEVITAAGWPAATGVVETLRRSDGRTVQFFAQKNGALVRMRWWNEVSSVWSSFAVPNASEFAAASRGLPSGGAAGQVLAKTSQTDFEAGWVTPSGGSGSFGTATPSAFNVFDNVAFSANVSQLSGDLRGSHGIPADAVGVWVMIMAFRNPAGGSFALAPGDENVSTGYSPRINLATAYDTVIAPVRLGASSNVGRVRGQSTHAITGTYVWTVGWWK
jgi:hypothetical protein